MSATVARTFTSLGVPNYRRYFGGQIVSISGNWMQTVAEMWLIVKLTGSGVSVGFTAGLQFLPILLFGAWGGLLADRFPKRTLLTCTNLAMAVPAATLWLLTVNGSVERILGVLAATLERWELADRHFAAASEVHERIAAPLFLARTWMNWGRALTSRGDEERGRDRLERAAELARRHDGAAIERETAGLLAGQVSA